MSLPDDLQKLQTLREQNALSEEEFVLAKKRLLEGDVESAMSNAAKAVKADRPRAALNQLRRSLTDRWIGGVCGGLAEMTGIPTWSWRILFVLATLLNGLGLVMYILLWIFVPLETHSSKVKINESNS